MTDQKDRAQEAYAAEVEMQRESANKWFERAKAAEAGYKLALEERDAERRDKLAAEALAASRLTRIEEESRARVAAEARCDKMEEVLREAHLAGRREGIGWALKSAADIVRASYPCTCGEAYKSRRLTAPDCFRCVPLEEAAVEIEGLLDRRALPDEPKPTDPCNADPTTE